MEAVVEPGFYKANPINIPLVGSETIFRFITKIATNSGFVKQDAISVQNKDLRIDFVQLQRVLDTYELRAAVFPAASFEDRVCVMIKVDTENDDILEPYCDRCAPNVLCQHIKEFIFWLHRKSADTDTFPIREFWGTEVEVLNDEKPFGVLRMPDFFPCDGEKVSNEMETQSLTDLDLCQQCGPLLDKFKPLFVRHILLNASINGVRDFNSFMQHIGNQANRGLIEQLSDASTNCYKNKLWLEVQDLRIPCSMVYRIATRKDMIEEKNILDALFSKVIKNNAEERQTLKQRKRFVLQQSHKLTNKTYQHGGLLLNGNYPYIYAAPDGITDDHIVEIKVPKTADEFEKYLEKQETMGPKYMTEIQMQMYMANVTKALYCVLCPNFDSTGKLHHVWVELDRGFVASLLNGVENFWKEMVFRRLQVDYDLLE